MIKKIIILVAVIAVGQGLDLCGLNELFTSLRCDAKCHELGIICNVVLPILGCFCNSNCARNSENKCVPKSSCCTKANEVYQSSGLEKTCEDKDGHGSPKEGCFCKADYFRNQHGDCVLIGECPTPFICPGPHEVYKNPTPLSDVTCSNLLDPCNFVPSNPENKCYCDFGYARNSHGLCIPEPDCYPPICLDPNEVYLTAEQAPLCEGTCATGGLSCGNTEPIAGCYCGPRYSRDLNGKCINVLGCKDLCTGPNEVFLPQGIAPVCDTHCNRHPDKCCPYVTNPNAAGCYCLNNYSRNKHGICIPTEFCSCKK